MKLEVDYQKKNKRHLFFRNVARFALFIIVLFSAASSIYLIITSYNGPSTNKGELLYSYSGMEDVDYSVNLFENSYVEESVLPAGENYISDLIRSIDAEFTYNYTGSKILVLKYTYDVKAIVYGEYDIDDEKEKVLKKEYVLVEPQSNIVSDTTSFAINTPVSIDYRFYNNVITSFKKDLKLPVNSYVEIKYRVNVVGIVDDTTIDDTKEKSLIIPLNIQAFKIGKKDNNNDEKIFKKEIREKIEPQKLFNKKQLIDGLVVLLLCIVLLLLTYRYIFDIRRKNNYTLRLKKILKEYGDIIVEINDPILDDDYNVINIKNFNEMIDLEEELRIPINFFEKVEDYEGEFTIINDKILYKYILDNKRSK